MKLSGMPFNQIRIGQIVRFDHSGKYAWVCRLDAERMIIRDHQISPSPRYDDVFVQHESGNVSGVFHMNCDGMEIIERVLEPNEIFDWPNIVNQFVGVAL